MEKEVVIGKDSIYKILYKMNNNHKIMLPAIQRNFVWSEEKVLRFVDSILLGYPIGTFLFWKIEGSYIKKNKTKISFYSFIDSYKYDDNINRNKINDFIDDNYYAVLDGQQRLSALNICYKGYIEVKKKKNSKKDDETLKKYLCINLLQRPKKSKDEDQLCINDIEFIPEDELEDREKKYWVKLSDIITTKDFLDKYKDTIKNQNKLKIISDNIDLVRRNFVNNKQRIQFYEIEEKDINVMLELFVRVNSGGISLQKSDLLFSTIVSIWDEGRQKVNNLLDNINRINGRKTFNFDTDFIMRLCLYLLDYTSLDMKVENFKEKDVLKIKKEWPKIEEAMKETVDFLVEISFNDDNIITYNAIMPIVYFNYKNGNFNNEKVRNELFKYFVVAQINKIFSRSTNTVLMKIRECLVNEKNELINKNFDLSSLDNYDNDGNNFKITEEKIDDWFKKTKGRYVYLILSLIRDGINDNGDFHQDHMHPNAILKKNPKFAPYKDKLANIQLITGKKNTRKRKDELKTWIESDTRHIPQLCPEKDGKYIYTESKDFLKFYEMRRKLIKENLYRIFGFKYNKDEEVDITKDIVE